jgi:hypothetical protein
MGPRAAPQLHHLGRAVPHQRRSDPVAPTSACGGNGSKHRGAQLSLNRQYLQAVESVPDREAVAGADHTGCGWSDE